MLLLFAIAAFILWLTGAFVVRFTDGVIHILLIAALMFGCAWIYQQIRAGRN